MTFTVNMEYLGQSYRVKWDDGKIEADEDIKFALEDTAELIAESNGSIGPIGMDLDPEDWSDGLAFLSLCIIVNDDGDITTSGELPTPPSVPEGAII
jgi:hypothetical protein